MSDEPQTHPAFFDRPNWHRGDWMQTYTGRKFYPLDPGLDDFDHRDIARSLSMQCRYNGHVHRFYSVAEHSVLLAEYFLGLADEGRPESETHPLALAALLHDGAEAYIGDMVRPLKRSMPDFRAVDDRLTMLIYQRFNVPFDEIPGDVRNADTRILLDERDQALAVAPADWNLGAIEPLGVRLRFLPPDEAEEDWLGMLRHLLGRA